MNSSALDLVPAGNTALIEAVEQDAEDRIHFAVIVETIRGRTPAGYGNRGIDVLIQPEIDPLTEEQLCVGF